MNKRCKGSIHILDGIGSITRGGSETGLMHVLRHIDRQRFQIDLLVTTEQHCAYDDEIRALGSKIIPSTHPSRTAGFARGSRHVLREHGPYDVVHTHGHHFGDYPLRSAYHSSAPVRIAHSHNGTSSLQAKARLRRRVYLRLMERWIDRYATVGLAASRKAAAALLGPNLSADPCWRVLHYGIDLTPFQARVDAARVRAWVGVPVEAFVMGRVGRLVAQKNRLFLVDIAAEVAKQRPGMVLLLVGDGRLRPRSAPKVAQEGLANRVVFTSVRPDVPWLMLGAMDVLLFPSLFGGLGRVLIEAQSAGLPCAVSDVVPEEADVVKPLMQRMALSQSASAWAEAILTARDAALPMSQPESLAIVQEGSFNTQGNVKSLTEVYLA
jgi:glycosyltransferase involved in cell wall biosynthesis